MTQGVGRGEGEEGREEEGVGGAAANHPGREAEGRPRRPGAQPINYAINNCNCSQFVDHCKMKKHAWRNPKIALKDNSFLISSVIIEYCDTVGEGQKCHNKTFVTLTQYPKMYSTFGSIALC